MWPVLCFLQVLESDTDWRKWTVTFTAQMCSAWPSSAGVLRCPVLSVLHVIEIEGLLIKNKVFAKRKILSIQTILNAYTCTRARARARTHTHTHTHTEIQWQTAHTELTQRHFQWRKAHDEATTAKDRYHTLIRQPRAQRHHTMIQQSHVQWHANTLIQQRQPL